VVVDHLRREIQLGHYSPGEKLPSERMHAESLGVSRVTLREALRVLEREGLVDIRRGPRGGTEVRQASLPARRRRVRRRLDHALAIQEFRFAIEPLAAARAAERRTPATLRQLRRSIEDMQAAENVGPFRRADTTFHLGLARAADCPPLFRAVEDARIEMFEPIDALDPEILIATAIKAHGAILAAVEARDGAAARRAMRAHIQETTRELEALF
jgi:GntR family transcriptional repressor for pyruvate dehydrogenase complex